MKKVIFAIAILVASISAQAQQRSQPVKYSFDSTSSFGASVNTLMVSQPQFIGNSDTATVSSSLVYVGKKSGNGQFSFRDVIILPDTTSIKYRLNTIAGILATKRGISGLVIH